MENYIITTEEYRFNLLVHLENKLKLVLSYNFLSKNLNNIYLFNKIYYEIDENDIFLTSKSSVYSEYSDGEIIICKKIISVPDDIDVEKPTIPCASKVEPNNKYEECLSLDLPITPMTPYFVPGDYDFIKLPYDLEAYFEIGFCI